MLKDQIFIFYITDIIDLVCSLCFFSFRDLLYISFQNGVLLGIMLAGTAVLAWFIDREQRKVSVIELIYDFLLPCPQ